MGKGIFFRLTDDEISPDGNNRYLSYDVQITRRGFSGVTEIVVPINSVLAFVAELETFYETLQGTPTLVIGWGEQEFLRLALSHHNLQGHVLVSCAVSRPSVGDNFDVCHAFWLTELFAIKKLARFLSAINPEEEFHLPPIS